MLPRLQGPASNNSFYDHKIADSIEGWSDAMKAIIEAYFYGRSIPVFDASLVRPKGATISGGFKAPGPEPLLHALGLVEEILKQAVGRKLTTLEAHEILCIIADAVISGGVRRSALLAMFSADDKDMMNCKTGDWFYKKPYLGRANNSAVILPDTPYEVYKTLFSAVKEFGEPGFIFLNDPEIMLNPCVEVGMLPYWINGEGKKEYGFAVCNLTEINGRKVDSREKFIAAARAGSIN
jgi:ribonucleoside-diphosphate reductase alpha chain